MLLILLIKIILCTLVIRHIIRWVSYHINHKNKTARVFLGNCRMPVDVELALLYGIYAKTKICFKDLSYRKNLVEWMCILNSLYPPDNLNFTRPLRVNANLADRKRKPFLFPQSETGKDNYIFIKKPYSLLIPKLFAKNNSVIPANSLNTKIISLKNLKIPQNVIPFPEETFACT
jgi:hypothetical protein